MADVLKVLGQVAAPATTETDLYTVPSSTSTTTSTLVVCNRSAGAVTCRVAVRPVGAVLADRHYLYYDKSVPANDSIFMTIGMTLAGGDIVTVYAASANLSFTLFGVETS